MASETYVHNGTEFKNANNIYVNVSGTFQGVDEAYANVGGTYKLVFSSFQATSFVTLATGTGTFTVPENANAIHIKSAFISSQYLSFETCRTESTPIPAGSPGE